MNDEMCVGWIGFLFLQLNPCNSNPDIESLLDRFHLQCRYEYFHFRMDENNDGSLTEEEFLKGCLQDDELSKMLAPNVAT